ncbi:MAG: adenosylmethionine decarboxylase [Zoogloeaceae bacterium]|nr:adenosylmethionine decarboxylase [Rhodocyclaceae bacterium]MCP5237102.1 adenosylmethionine decarboxylase [Zoogloeaceae bacterium]
MNGLHLIADMYRCQCSEQLLIDRETLEALCVSECATAGLTPLGSYFYQFTHDDGQKAGVTGTVVLAESHLAIHTWPESGSVTLDIYVCNFSRDNSELARHLFHKLHETLAPIETIDHQVVRGKLLAAA